VVRYAFKKRLIKEDNNVKIAILDDYQQVAVQSADWSSLPSGTEVNSFAETIADQGELVRRVQPYDVIVAMPPFLNVTMNEKVSSVSALTIFPVAVSTMSGRSPASQPVTEAISPNQNRSPSM